MASTTPQHGDLVVRSEPGPHRRTVFVLTRIGAQWETTCVTYEEAVRAAERTAHVYNSNIWFARDAASFDLVSQASKRSGEKQLEWGG